MKRLIALMLAFVLLLSLSACGDDSVPNENDDKVQTTGETAAPTTEQATIPTDEPTESLQETTEETEPENEITFLEMVAVDNEECKITIKKIESDDIWGYSLKATLENKSDSKTYMFSVESGSINGVVCAPFFASEVTPGKKANEEIIFNTTELKENGITDFTDLELRFRVYDSNDWTADPVAEETVHVYPYGEDKAALFVREEQSTDKVIIDNEFVQVIITGYEEDDILGYTVNVFLVNKTDTRVMFAVEDASVNGYMADPFFATGVPAGKCEFASISWFDSLLEDNEITEIETIEFNIRAYDDNDWLSEDFANEKVTLAP